MSPYLRPLPEPVASTGSPINLPPEPGPCLAAGARALPRLYTRCCANCHTLPSAGATWRWGSRREGAPLPEPRGAVPTAGSGAALAHLSRSVGPRVKTASSPSAARAVCRACRRRPAAIKAAWRHAHTQNRQRSRGPAAEPRRGSRAAGFRPRGHRGPQMPGGAAPRQTLWRQKLGPVGLVGRPGGRSG